MDNQFLKQVASLFAKEDDLKGYTFIFPNRRSSLFFRMYLGQEHGKPMFAPRIKTISDVFSDLSDKVVPSHITLMMKLWKVWCAEQRKAKIAAGIPEKDIKDETADDFFLWGHILLTDFNDVDQYMVDPVKLFQNIKDFGDIHSDYSFLDEKQIEALEKLVGKDFKSRIKKKEYLDIWNLMLPLYNSFRQLLSDENKSYPGMQERLVSEAIIRIDNGKMKEGDIAVKEKLELMGKAVFVGFSAPTKCDKILMSHFKDGGKGLFYWDFYSSMLKSEQNRASKLISKCVEDFGCSLPIDGKGGIEETEDGKTKCKFTVIPVSGKNEQAIIASSLLKENDSLETAIVLSDETLLLPLLGTVRNNSVNITMGYPFRASSAYSLISMLIDLILRAGIKNGKVYLSGNILCSIFNHTYIRHLNSLQAGKASSIILEGNMISISSDILNEERPLDLEDDSLKIFLKKLFPSGIIVEDGEVSSVHGDSLTKALVGYFRDILEFISGKLPSRERLFLNKCHDSLDGLYSSGAEFTRKKTICSVLRRDLVNASVSFSGEPLEGVQIMGPLETRCLDFDKIIFLSFNEGVFPANGEQSSCIPYCLRKGFDLPTFEEKDSISAYNFYRLIQRAKEVYLIYESQTEGSDTKEESRFVKQLVYDYGVTPVRRHYKFPLPVLTESFDKNIEVNSDDLTKLRSFFSDLSDGAKEKYMSASSLNTYIDCQRKFFLSYVLGASKDDELTDKVEYSTFGSIYHFCMELIYNSFLTRDKKTDKIIPLEVDGNLMAKVMDKVSDDSDLEGIIFNAFKHVMKVSDIDGENLIIREAVKKYILNTVTADMERAKVYPFTLCGNEFKIKRTLASANIKGFIDRLEKQGPIPRICDYKTGRYVDVKKKNPAEDLKNAGFELIPAGSLLSPYREYDNDEFKEELEKVFSAEPRDKFHEILFQQLLYAHMIRIENNHKGAVELAIYQLRIVEKFGPVRILVTEEQLDMFAMRLEGLVSEIRAKVEGKSEPVFALCQDKEICTNCDFKNFCKRG